MQAMGKGKEFSSAEDTDTDTENWKFDESLIEIRAIEQMMENVYWGDSEDDVKMTKDDDKELESFDSKLVNVDGWKCSRFIINYFYLSINFYALAARLQTSQTLVQNFKISSVLNAGTKEKVGSQIDQKTRGNLEKDLQTN